MPFTNFQTLSKVVKVCFKSRRAICFCCNFALKLIKTVRMQDANESNENVLESLLQKDQQERLALASDASTILSRLNISVENLPQKCQQLLREASTAQLTAGVGDLDLVGVTLLGSIGELQQMDDEYEILQLKQKNKQLQAKIDRNAIVIEQLKRELSQSKTRLSQQTPNPDNIDQYCRQMKQKLASYDSSYQRAKAKFSSLAVPVSAMPGSLVSLASELGSLSEQAAALRQRAEDVELASRARNQLRQLRK